MTKQYQHKNGVTFFFKYGGKWTFKKDNFELLYPAQGHEIAAKIAGQVGAALKRTNGEGLDNLARGAIKVLTNTVE